MEKLPPDALEFQMLYGTRRGEEVRVAKAGEKFRVLRSTTARPGGPGTCGAWPNGRRTCSSSSNDVRSVGPRHFTIPAFQFSVTVIGAVVVCGMMIARKRWPSADTAN